MAVASTRCNLLYRARICLLVRYWSSTHVSSDTAVHLNIRVCVFTIDTYQTSARGATAGRGRSGPVPYNAIVGYSFGLYILFVYGIYTWGARLREIFC